MSEKVENPQAFPVTYNDGHVDGGMKLRDFIATNAAIAFINNKDFEDAKYSVVARHSYDFADEMLKARNS